jgi:hypothetical protein
LEIPVSEYDLNGDGYPDEEIVVDYGDTTATVIDVDGDGYADVVVVESTQSTDLPYQEDAADPDWDTPAAPADQEPAWSHTGDYTDASVGGDGDFFYHIDGDSSLTIG